MSHRFGHPTDYDFDEPTQPAEELVERSMEDDQIDQLMVDRALARNTARRLEVLHAANGEPGLEDIKALGRLKAERDEILATARLYGLLTSPNSAPPAPDVRTIRPAMPSLPQIPRFDAGDGWTSELLHDEGGDVDTVVPVADSFSRSHSAPSWNTYPEAAADDVQTDIHYGGVARPDVQIPTPPRGRPKPPRPGLGARLFRALFPEEDE